MQNVSVFCILLMQLLNILVIQGAQDPVPDERIVHFFNTSVARHNFTDSSDGKPMLQIFCRERDPKALRYYFRSVKLQVSSSAEDVRYFRGGSDVDVYKEYLTASRWYMWAAELLPWRIREVRFPTFNSSCVGVATSKQFTAALITRPIDPWNLVLFIGGVTLFFLSSRLAKSSTFFYTSGTIFGGVAAILVLLFILSRSLPKGKISYITISVLWTMCLYFAGESWNRIEELLHEKLPYILGYLTAGALIAFITCYRVGPPSHPKTLDIVKWFLQALSLGLIHLSSELVEVSTAFIVLIIFSYYLGDRLKMFYFRMWRRLFPPKMKLLTEEEYISQGNVETEKNLRQLREFCSSPDCNSWKIVGRLKDPKRFASFVDGDSHLSDDELMAYESFLPEDDDGTTDDESNHGEVDVSSMMIASFNRSLPRSPSRQGTPRPRVVRSHENGSANTRTLRSGSRSRTAPANEYLTDDDSPNNTVQTDDED